MPDGKDDQSLWSRFLEAAYEKNKEMAQELDHFFLGDPLPVATAGTLLKNDHPQRLPEARPKVKDPVPVKISRETPEAKELQQERVENLELLKELKNSIDPKDIALRLALESQLRHPSPQNQDKVDLLSNRRRLAQERVPRNPSLENQIKPVQTQKIELVSEKKTDLSFRLPPSGPERQALYMELVSNSKFAELAAKDPAIDFFRNAIIDAATTPNQEKDRAIDSMAAQLYKTRSPELAEAPKIFTVAKEMQAENVASHTIGAIKIPKLDPKETLFFVNKALYKEFEKIAPPRLAKRLKPGANQESGLNLHGPDFLMGAALLKMPKPEQAIYSQAIARGTIPAPMVEKLVGNALNNVKEISSLASAPDRQSLRSDIEIAENTMKQRPQESQSVSR